MDTISILNIEREAERRESHWFEPDTLRFFRSRIASVAYRSADGLRAWFVSSEKFTSPRGDGPRLFSVRVANLSTDSGPGFIDTVGKFQAFETAGRADTAARRACKAYDLEHGHVQERR